MNKSNPKRSQDLLSMEGILEISGLDMMQGILKGIYPPAPISHILNYGLYAVEKGKVVFRGAPTLECRNPMGTLHGGWYGTLLDSAMACAVMTTLPAGKIQTTLEFKLNIIRSVPIGTIVVSKFFGKRNGTYLYVSIVLIFSSFLLTYLNHFIFN